MHRAETSLSSPHRIQGVTLTHSEIMPFSQRLLTKNKQINEILKKYFTRGVLASVWVYETIESFQTVKQNFFSPE